MIKLRPSVNSLWLAFLVVACGSDESDGTGAATTTTPTDTPTSVGPVTSPGGSNTGVAPTVGPATVAPGTIPVGPGSVPPVVGPTASGPDVVGPTPTGPTGVAPTPTGPTGTVSPTGVVPTDVAPTGVAPTGPVPTDVTPEPEPPEPSLIVSSEGSFWNTGEVTKVDSGTPNFTVDTSNKFQKWLGWGGTFNEAGWDALKALSDTDRATAMKMLFDPVEGIGFDWGRIPIGPSDYALERYTLSSGPGDFSIDHDMSTLIPFIQEAQKIKGDVKYWASPWSPPPWAKTGMTENGGYDKGIFNDQYYQEYADYFVDWIQAYEDAGIPINAVMAQNEPGWAQSYPTCAFGPARDSTNSTDIPNPVTLGTFIDGYLFPSIDAAGLTTGVWFGTQSNNSFFDDYWNDMKSKASADRIVGVALQWETQASIGKVDSNKYLIMQSEHKCGNYPWGSSEGYVTHQTNQTPSGVAPNDFNYGQESWDLMKSWIDDGVNIYSAWNMVLDTHGTNLDAVRVWNQNAMLVVDRDAKKLIPTPYYYVFRHFAQYVDGDATRVGVNGEAVAFQNTKDNSVVVVMRTSSPGSQIVSIDGTLLQFEAAGNGWVTVNWKPE